MGGGEAEGEGQPSQVKSGQELVFALSMLRSSWEEVKREAPEREVSQPRVKRS